MHQRLQVSKYTALKELVLRQLATALDANNSAEEMSCIKDKTIPLSKSRDCKRVLYISGVALQLSKSHNLPAMEIASQINSHLSTNCSDNFSVQISPPGWLHIEISDHILAAWLQQFITGRGGEKNANKSQSLIVNSQSQIENQKSKIKKSLFTVQYAHARCCSLVRLGNKERLIKLGKPDTDISAAIESVISPDPIPWLNCKQKLCLSHPVSRRLIAELVQIVDNLECPSLGRSTQWEKAALDLSQAFENFWCNCRIWGEVKINSLELAQARLGLVMATQSVLRFLLEEKLGVFAPLEL